MPPSHPQTPWASFSGLAASSKRRKGSSAAKHVVLMFLLGETGWGWAKGWMLRRLRRLQAQPAGVCLKGGGWNAWLIMQLLPKTIVNTRVCQGWARHATQPHPRKPTLVNQFNNKTTKVANAKMNLFCFQFDFVWVFGNNFYIIKHFPMKIGVYVNN